MPGKLVLFDLDGTLVNTIFDIGATFNRVLRTHGFPVHPLEAYPSFVGWGLSRTLEMALPHKISVPDFKAILVEVNLDYQNHACDKSHVYPGMDVLLCDLKNRGFHLAVLTNKSELIAQKIIHTFFSDDVFDFVAGHREGMPLKPDPESLFQRLDDKKFDVSSILMVGDSPVDVHTARGAGIGFAGVSWGYRDEQELRDAGAKDVFHRPEILYKKILEGWESK